MPCAVRTSIWAMKTAAVFFCCKAAVSPNWRAVRESTPVTLSKKQRGSQRRQHQAQPVQRQAAADAVPAPRCAVYVPPLVPALLPRA